MMVVLALVALALTAFACTDPLQPRQSLDDVLRPATAASEETGPPPRHEFGTDTYQIDTLTGEGITQPGLQCENLGDAAKRCEGFLPSAVDGTLLDVLVEVPAVGGRLPLIVLVHGYGGSKHSSDDIADRLLENGYVVLRYSTRGMGDSWGQINLVDVNAEVGDLRSMITQAVEHRGLRINEDAVAVTGASYGGGHSWMAALRPTFTTPEGYAVRIRTIVPIVPWTDLVYSLLPNGQPRNSIDHPGGAKLSYINALYVSGLRDDPERPYLSYPNYMVQWHAWINGAEPTEQDPVYQRIEDGLAGYRSIWWQYDFWRDVTTNRIPIFQVQGFTDDLFPLPEALRMMLALQTLDPTYPIASYFGDIGHPRAANKEAEMDYVLDLAEQWFAYYLKEEGTPPPNVIHAAITRPRSQPFSAGDVITVSTWDALATSVASFSVDTSALLLNPVDDPMRGFTWDPLVIEGWRELEPLPMPPESPVVEGSLVAFERPVSELSGGGDLLIAGQPSVSFTAFTSAHRVQLNVRVFELRGEERHLITRGTLTLDSGLEDVAIGEMAVTIPTYGNVWEAEAGSRLRVEITNLDSPYIRPSLVPSVTQISDVQVEIPVR